MNERAKKSQQYEPTYYEHIANTFSHGVIFKNILKKLINKTFNKIEKCVSFFFCNLKIFFKCLNLKLNQCLFLVSYFAIFIY